MGQCSVQTGKLNEAEERIIQSFIIDFNVIRTAKRLEMSVWNLKNALDRPLMKKAIDEIKTYLAEKTNVNMERIIQELAEIAFFDIKDHVKKLKPGIGKDKVEIEWEEWENINGKVVKEIRYKEVGGMPVIELGHYSKKEALLALAEILQKTQGFGGISKPQQLEDKSLQEAADAYFEIVDN